MILLSNLWEKTQQESIENPKMVQCYVENTTWQQAFVFGLCVEHEMLNKYYERNRLLFIMMGGADSTVQSMKTAIDCGLHSMKFGYGKKNLTGYDFESEFDMVSDKGKYSTFPMKVGNRKVVAMVHDEIMEDGKFLMSFEGDPTKDFQNLLKGKNYGLPILDEWKDTIFNECVKRGYLQQMELYIDQGVFPNGFFLYKVEFTEEQADDLLEEMLQTRTIQLPKSGTGKAVEEIDGLTAYMQQFNQPMVEKLAEKIKPSHNPLENEIFPYFDSYETELFPAQGHVATAIAKRLKTQKSVILQGEMSTGKSKMTTAIADGYMKMKGKEGFHCLLMVPPSLTDKWSTEEIYDLLPNPRSKVIRIDNTSQLIQYHQNWMQQGRKKPKVPTFFVCSFTTMRGDSALKPAVTFTKVKTKKQLEDDTKPYKFGYYCPCCGEPLQVIQSRDIQLNENGEEEVVVEKRIMVDGEFGESRRLHNTKQPANAFCTECGESLWTKVVPTRYGSFKEWAQFEDKLIHAIEHGNKEVVNQTILAQPEIPKKVGQPRRIATSEYIRRKMKKFFDVLIVDEIHELKAGMSAQGNALGSLASACKKVIGATGTLFGGLAQDIYYTLWRLWPHEMVQAGYAYSEVSKWNHEYGNVETSYMEMKNESEYSNKQSRGGNDRKRQKVVPGISPFVFSRFLLHNTVLLRLKDVWPNPVELVDVPTILVDMDEAARKAYQDMTNTFENAIHSREDGFKLFLPYTETGISYPDNPYTYPEYHLKTEDGYALIWEPEHIKGKGYTSPKEAKLQEIIKGEKEEGRPVIVYVKDTGSSREGRDIRPRLKEKLEEIGCKVAILDTNTTKTDKRSQWLRKKVEDEGHDVIIVSAKLVKVGLDCATRSC